MLLPLLYNIGVMAYWLSNRTYIASTLCIKRDEPGNCCQGSCYLNQKLSQTPSTPLGNEEKLPELSRGFDLAELSPALPFSLFWNEENEEKGPFPALSGVSLRGYSRGIFHPPAGA